MYIYICYMYIYISLQFFKFFSQALRMRKIYSKKCDLVANVRKLKDTINPPYDCLSKNNNFSVKTTND